MTERKPNNLPWIILGCICGLGVLGLFGLGVYSGAKAVSDEMTVTLPDRPEPNVRSSAKNAVRIVVNAENEISFENRPFKDVGALEDELKLRLNDDLISTAFILELSEKAPHTSLISMKDMLDGLGAKTIIKIQRSNTE